MEIPASYRVRNHLPALLPRATLAAIKPGLQRIKPEAGQVIYRSNTVVQTTYFPEDGIALVVDLHDGIRTEIGLAGREGMACDRASLMTLG